MRYNYKDTYYNKTGENIINVYPSRYYASVAAGGNGTREMPLSSRSIGIASNNVVMIFGGGYNKTSITSDSDTTRYLNGNGMGTTVIEFNHQQNQSGGLIEWFFKDFSLAASRFGYNGYTRTDNKLYFDGCEILQQPSIFQGGSGVITLYVNNCLIRDVITNNKIVLQSRNSFAGLYNTRIAASTQLLYDNCDVVLTAADITGANSSYYLAFDKCRLKIGGETDFTELTGTTAAELRADFVTRCEAQGITPVEFDEYGEMLKQGRWIFTKGASFQGVVIGSSEIHQYELTRGISFGYTSRRANKVSITDTEGTANAFTPSNASSVDLVFAQDSMSFGSNVDITDKNTFTADSNVIYLGGKKELTYMNVLNNMPFLYGVNIDSSPDMMANGILPGENRIEAGKYYVVRSTDKEFASVSYNGNTFTTSLDARVNIIKGFDGITSYTANNATNPIIYEITDELQYKSIQVRIVNKIPPTQIKSGNLQDGYWYFVEHDTDQSNPTDYVTYKGVNYFAGGSFLVNTDLTFSISGNIHLRRCWNKDFNYDTEKTDKAFWQNEQKPQWSDVLPDDLRCLMKNNSGVESEMQADGQGNYITTGHPDFYNMIVGSGGFSVPAYPVRGTYMQIRLVLSTLNLM